MFLLKLFCIVVSWVGGIVINHWFARRFFSATEHISEREILLHGLLASIVINGMLGTYLAVLKIFNLYSFAGIAILVMYVLRSDLVVTLDVTSQAIRHWKKQLRGFNIATIAATGLMLSLALALTVLCRLPNQNPDGWAFHLPIAQSIIKNNGFVYPFIESLNYSSQPSFVSVLFAEALLLYPHYAVASLVNVLIYLSTLVAMAAFWKRFGLALSLVLIIVGLNFNLITGVPTVLTDMTRTCFSVLGICYLAFYNAKGVQYYAALAAVCVGAAIATKYTELVTLLLMTVVLSPLVKTAKGRILLGKCALIVVSIGSFWYIKNIILLKNPIYPFIFGHPGLSDDWMAWYLKEMTLSFDPAHRHFVRSLFSTQGWIDLFSVLWTWFFKDSITAKLCLGMSLMGAFISRRLIAPMLAIALGLFVYWYIVLFNHIRWAKPAIMLLLVTGCYALFVVFEKFYTNENKKYIYFFTENIFNNAFKKIIIVIVFVIGLGYLINATGPALSGGKERWTLYRSIEPLIASFTSEGIDRYLSKTREGYSIIRFVIENNLYNVFQPFQEGINTYAKVYNNGIDGKWFVDINSISKNQIGCSEFIENNNIRYYVTRPSLSPIDVGRLGPERLAFAYEVIDCVKSNSKLIFEDINGWKLYDAQRR